MKTALLMLAVDPSLGGVLIRGERGTATSTAARALAQLLPPIVAAADSPYREPPTGDQASVRLPTPLVELPIGATEDRLIGSLAVEVALREGRRQFEPGLLAAANRGILYVDEVNLLDDHLVDVLLDAAASGVNRIEREGISLEHPARFMLIGTMNPEEGELRPQFLDRFGLCVTVDGQSTVAARREIVRRRLAFEDDPRAFIARWAEAEGGLRDAIAAARETAPDLDVPEAIWNAAAELAHAAAARGHGAEIGMVKAARALAAFLGRPAVDRETLAEAARYVLPHRMSTQPLESIADVRRRIEQLIAGNAAARPDDGQASGREGEDAWDDVDGMQIPGAAAAGSLVLDYIKKKTDDRTFDPDPLIDVAEIDVAGASTHRFGRHGTVVVGDGHGRYVRARALRDLKHEHDIALDATLRAVALHAAQGVAAVPLLPPRRGDLRVKLRERARRGLTVFVLDASDSMGAHQLMAAAKGATLALLTPAYQRRDRVAVVVFRDAAADVLLPATNSVTLARRRLRRLPVGGATPLAEGLLRAWKLVSAERRKDPHLVATLVLISDGDANVPLGQSRDCVAELLSLTARIRDDGIAAVAIDTLPRAPGPVPMRRIAVSLGASYHHIDRLRAAAIMRAVGDI